MIGINQSIEQFVEKLSEGPKGVKLGSDFAVSGLVIGEYRPHWAMLFSLGGWSAISFMR